MNLKRLRLNTDYPLDKIILLFSGSQTIPAGVLTNIDIPHGQSGYIPLPWGNWAFNSSFSVAYEFDTGPITTGGIASAYTVAPTIEANATNIRISVPNYYTAGTFTLHYRIFCFAPSNLSSLSIESTNVNVDKFMLNTDQQQVQLMENNLITYAGGSGTVITPLFEHNLGYSPQILYWDHITSTGIVRPRQQHAEGSGVSIYSDNTNAYLIRQGNWLAGTVYYRIYVNE